MKKCWVPSGRFLSGLIFLTILTSGCGGSRSATDEAPVARVYQKYLYPSDLREIVPAELTGTDSINFVKQYVNQWVNRQLLLRQAEYNLSRNKVSYDQLIEDYRASLLIHEYQKMLLVEKTDTVISESEIESFYRRNLMEFQLAAPIVKALYIRIQKDNGKVPEIKRLLRSTSDASFENLVNLSYQYADRFDFFNDSWVSFQLITQNIPGSPEDQDAFLRSRSLMEVEDEQFIHLLQIHEYKLSGEIAPIEYVYDRIRDMIMTDRRQQLIEELNESVFQEAVEKNNFEIFEQ